MTTPGTYASGLTYQDYLTLPDDLNQYELYEGS